MSGLVHRAYGAIPSRQARRAQHLSTGLPVLFCVFYMVFPLLLFFKNNGLFAFRGTKSAKSTFQGYKIGKQGYKIGKIG